MHENSGLPPIPVMLTTARGDSMNPPLVNPDESTLNPSSGSMAISALPCLKSVIPEQILPNTLRSVVSSASMMSSQVSISLGT